MRRPSIRQWLLFRSSVAIASLLTALGIALYYIMKQSMLQALDESISQTAALLANEVELENGIITFEWQEGLGSNRTLTTSSLFQFWDEQTGITTRSPALATADLPKFCGNDRTAIKRSIDLPNGARGRAIGLRVHPFVDPEEVLRLKLAGRIATPENRTLVLVVAADAEPLYQTLNRLRWILAAFLISSVAVGFLIIARVVRLALKPIKQLEKQVKNRNESQVDQALKLPANLPSELLGLTENFNLLLGRVAGLREREFNFVRMLTHELRTPIAGLRATTELALSKQRDIHEYQQQLALCHQAAIELNSLINRLSSLAKLGHGDVITTLVKFDIAKMLDECLEPFIPQFNLKNLRLTHSTSSKALLVQGDPFLAQLIITNLLDNALAYASSAGDVQIQYDDRSDSTSILISNSTQCPLDEIDRWFEPLFRTDVSRQDSVQHLGIGLALSLNAAYAMGWILQASSPAPDRVLLELKVSKSPV